MYQGRCIQAGGKTKYVVAPKRVIDAILRENYGTIAGEIVTELILPCNVVHECIRHAAAFGDKTYCILIDRRGE